MAGDLYSVYMLKRAVVPSCPAVVLDPYLSLPLTPAVAAVMMFSVVSRTALNVDPSACISSLSTSLFLILILQQVCIFLSGSKRT